MCVKSAASLVWNTLHFVCCCDVTSATPGLSFPPSLQHFELGGDVFEPSVLAATTHLTELNLGRFGFHQFIVDDEGDVSGGARLLGFLSQLQHLDCLRLSHAQCNWPPASPAYQALVTSSSTLRVLLIDFHGLPDSVFAHVFPSAPSHLVLPRLEDLCVVGIPPGAVAGVVGCCPVLQKLSLGMAAPGCAHLAALSQLSALTCLELLLKAEDDGGEGVSSAVPIQSVAGLTRLQELSVQLTARGQGYQDLLPLSVLPLTALQQLTSLRCESLCELETQVGACFGQADPALVLAHQ